MKQKFLDKIIKRLTDRPTSQHYEVLFFGKQLILFFKYNTTKHCSHLPMLAATQTYLKPKSKKYNIQRFLE